MKTVPTDIAFEGFDVLHPISIMELSAFRYLTPLAIRAADALVHRTFLTILAKNDFFVFIIVH
tara:strand:+ start:640 stop:828 length:189 start_codon:yes stop_codon:yes gene_type:complete